MVKIMVLLASLLSATIPESDTMVYFSLSESMGMRMFSGYNYLVEETKDGRVHFLFNKGYPDEKEYYSDDHSVFDSLGEIVRKYDMVNYKTDYMPEIPVTDGQSWSLYVKFASKTTIRSGGYMAGPDGWRKAEREIRECLQYWADMPAANNDVVTFIYEYGPLRYLMERKDDHSVLTFDNKETGEHQVYERDLGMLDDARILVNILELKENRTRGTLDEGCTPWAFDITYVNGTRYRYESYDRDYKCGYTIEIQGFIGNCLEGKAEGQAHYIYF